MTLCVIYTLDKNCFFFTFKLDMDELQGSIAIRSFTSILFYLPKTWKNGTKTTVLCDVPLIKILSKESNASAYAVGFAGYAADSSVPILDFSWNVIDYNIGSSTMFFDHVWATVILLLKLFLYSGEIHADMDSKKGFNKFKLKLKKLYFTKKDGTRQDSQAYKQTFLCFSYHLEISFILLLTCTRCWPLLYF